MEKTNAKLLVVFLLLSFFCNINFLRAENQLKNTFLQDSHLYSIIYLKDDSASHTIESIASANFSTCTSLPANFGIYKGVVWFRLKIGALQKGKWLLEIKNSLLDEVVFYQSNGGKWVARGKSGDQVISNEKVGRFHQFPIQSNQEILLKITNLGDELLVPIEVITEKDLQHRNLWEQFYLGIYFGIILFVTIANLFVLILLRDKTNLFYFGYLASIILLQLSHVGYGKAYFWVNEPFFANSAPPLFGSLATLFGILFSQSILRLKKYLPFGNNILNVFAVLAFVNVVFSLIPSNFFYQVSGTFTNILSLITAIILVIVGIFSYKGGFRPARFFFLGFFFFLVFIIVFLLHNFGYLPTNFFTEYSLVFGSFIEINCLTFTLIDTFGLHKQKTLKTLVEINKLQTEQNANLEKGVQERTLQIQQKNKELQIKSKEILDSIHYAKLIQKGLILPEDKVNTFLQDSFVIFKPKDIVSGDFYWLTNLKGTTSEGHNRDFQILCLADCTGHGVPGAIISVLGLRILDAVVKRQDIASPAQALDAINHEFSTIFEKENSSNQMFSGMDAVICSMNKTDMKLQFAGAKNDLYLVRKGVITKYKGDRKSIGEFGSKKGFTLHQINLQKGDCIYLTTDGFMDQFGGLENKKMKFTFLKEFISNQYLMPMVDQKSIILQHLNNWIGSSNEQTDDICLIGFRV